MPRWSGEVRISTDASFWLDEKYSLQSVKVYEDAGFDSVWFADHFLPWQHSFKHSPFVWSLMAAAAERSRKIRVGVDVTSPIGGRYHPALIAQAVGTLASMYPNRIYLGVGTGEALNDGRFMETWPRWKERMERLVEGVALIRKLLESDDYFDFDGKYFKMKEVFLYTKPKERVPIYFSGIGEKAARFAGMYGDHLMTDNPPRVCAEKIFPLFDEGARSAGKDPRTMEKAVLVLGGVGDTKQTIEKLRKLIVGGEVIENVNQFDPRKIAEEAMKASDDFVRGICHISESVDELIELFSEYCEAGANHIIYTDFSPDPVATARLFSEKVIPYFKNRG